jgi:signal transduction histidine kinase
MITRWARDCDPAEEAQPPVRRGRDAAVNAAMVVLVGALAMLSTKHVVYGLDGYPLALRLADVVCGTIVLIGIWFWRRRWPVGFAVLAVLVGVFSTVASMVGPVAVFTVAVHRRWPTAVLVSLFTAVMVVPGILLYPSQGTHHTLADSIGGPAITFAATGWGMFVRARRELVASLRNQVVQAEAEVVRRAAGARRSERERMAREMHDVLAHRLSLLAVHAGALEFRADASREQVAEAAGVIRANTHEALVELRSVINVLRADDTVAGPERPQPTLADLVPLIEESRAAGLRVSFDQSADVPEYDRSLPTSAGRALYRVVQEALTNVRKHAPASPAVLELSGRPGERVEISVRNRRSALTSTLPPGPGTGLIGLRERTTLAGGAFESGPTSDGDFLVRAWLPWPEVSTLIGADPTRP